MARSGKTAKRPVARKTYNKVKKVMAKKTKASFKKGMDTHSLFCTSTAILSPVQGGTVANYINCWVPLMDPSGPISFAQNADFAVYRYLYDKVRINSVTVKLIPKANTFDIATAQNDSLTVSGDGLVHTAIDRNGPVPLSSTNAMQVIQRYGSHKAYSLLKPFTRKYSIRYPKGLWFDSTNIFEDDSLIHRLGGSGGVQIYAENVVEDRAEIYNEPWASMEVTYHVVFMGKKPSNVSLSSAGLTLSLPELGTPLAPSGLSKVVGTLADTDYATSDDTH